MIYVIPLTSQAEVNQLVSLIDNYGIDTYTKLFKVGDEVRLWTEDLLSGDVALEQANCIKGAFYNRIIKVNQLHEVLQLI